MKASELRIGNLVLANKELINPVGVIEVDVSVMQSPHLFSPIPLTEEWLVKFGCEYKPITRFDKTIDKYLSMDAIQFETDYNSGFEWDNDKLYLCDCDGGKVGKQIEYVHQLQNLYFALTGEELTIK